MMVILALMSEYSEFDSSFTRLTAFLCQGALSKTMTIFLASLTTPELMNARKDSITVSKLNHVGSVT